MWEIIKNEWRFLARNRALLVTSLGFIVVLFITIFLGYRQTQEQSSRYQDAKKHFRTQWENNREIHPHAIVHYGTYVFKPANLLSSIDEGINSVTGNILRLEGHVQNEITHTEASQTQAVSKFGKLKSSLLLQYIIPLLLIFMSFQSINSEKQSGRLKLLVLQGANPARIVLAKTLSVCLYGIGLLALTVLSYTVFNFKNLNTEILTRTLLLFFSYSLYYFIVSGLTVFLSARLKNTATALTSMLGVWIIWTIFLPNILLSSVEQWHMLPSRNAFKKAMKEDRSNGINGHNPANGRIEELKKKLLAEYSVDSISKLPFEFWGVVMQQDEEYGNIVWDKHFGSLREVLARQKRSYQLGGLVNPFISLQNLSMGFAGNDNIHHQEFLLQAENYRRGFVKKLNDKHAYGGTKTEAGDWDVKTDPAFYKAIADFEYQPTKISSVFSSYLTDLILLIFWMLLSVLLLIFGAKKIKIA
jgi:ABC-2 type transport system permease protein